MKNLILGSSFAIFLALSTPVQADYSEFPYRDEVESSYECGRGEYSNFPVPVTCEGRTWCFNHHELISIGSPCSQLDTASDW